jgi:MFS superfamily sulfate permease-like transporter
VPGVLIVRLDAPLYYANALTARERLKAMVREVASPPKAVIFDAEGQDELDLTSANVLKGLVADLRGEGVAVYFAGVHAPVLERARETGLLDVVGDDRVHATVDLAVKAFERQSDASDALADGDRERRQP